MRSKEANTWSNAGICMHETKQSHTTVLWIANGEKWNSQERMTVIYVIVRQLHFAGNYSNAVRFMQLNPICLCMRVSEWVSAFVRVFFFKFDFTFTIRSGKTSFFFSFSTWNDDLDDSGTMIIWYDWLAWCESHWNKYIVISSAICGHKQRALVTSALQYDNVYAASSFQTLLYKQVSR